MVKIPPANSGDTGSIPGQGRFYTPRGNHVCKLQLLKPAHPGASEATAKRNVHSATREQPPLAATRESRKLVHSTEDSVLPKVNQINSNDFISAFSMKKKKSPNDFIHNDRRKEKMRTQIY